MLIGLPGSGKSDVARQIGDGKSVILSSSALRKELSSDETKQNASSKVFEEMQRRMTSALKEGKDVIYDATNICRKKRRHLLSSITFPCQKIAYVIWSRFETCLARWNNNEHTINRMLLNFQPPYYDEGWDIIDFKINDAPYRYSDYENWLDRDRKQNINNIAKSHTFKITEQILKFLQDTNQIDDIMTILMNVAKLKEIGKKFVINLKNKNRDTTETVCFYNIQNVSSYFAIGYEETMRLSPKQRALIYWLISVRLAPLIKTKYIAALPDNLSKLLDIIKSI